MACSSRSRGALKVIDELGGPKYYNHFPAGWAHGDGHAVSVDQADRFPLRRHAQPGGHLMAGEDQREGRRAHQFHHVTDIMPTILEAAGIQAPDSLNGVTQKPIEGVSMVYTFNDAKAPDRRKSQIFELVSNRGMYQNGWMASSMAYLPWAATRTGYDPDKAKWELYNIDQDFSQATISRRRIPTS
jgi:hypothetical protein